LVNLSDDVAWPEIRSLSDASGALRRHEQEIDEGQNLSEPKRLLLQEVTVAGLDKPMRLTTLSASVCDVGLNVREAHVFSTKNGYLLDIFVTDPLPGVDAEDLEDVRAHAPALLALTSFTSLLSPPCSPCTLPNAAA
jgi:serine/threonine-protein kinase TNNI3K